MIAFYNIRYKMLFIFSFSEVLCIFAVTLNINTI